jgi:hypothetical protein
LDNRVNEAVAKAVAESEARTRELLAASDKQHALETQAMKVRFDEYVEVERKRQNTLMVASNEAGSANGDAR